MNRYPVWKYAIIVVALLVGALYTLPNFFGEAPAVQVSAGKSTVKVDSHHAAAVEQALKAAGHQAAVPSRSTANSVKVRAGQHRRPAQGQGRDPEGAGAGPGRPCLHGGAEPAVALAQVADRAARRADVPGPGPARRRALHAAGGHAGGADQEGRVVRRRPAHACCARRTSATAASAATARPSRCASATPQTLEAAKRVHRRPVPRPADRRRAGRHANTS